MQAVKQMLVVLIIALFAVTGIASTAMAAKTIKLHHLNKDDPFDNPTGAMATVFKSLVESGTNGAIEVQTFPSGQLGKDKDVVQQVKAGVIQAEVGTMLTDVARLSDRVSNLRKHFDLANRDIDQIETRGGGNIDFTVGSALDIFGGSGCTYEEAVKFCR